MSTHYGSCPTSRVTPNPITIYVQDLALALVKLHEISTGPLLTPVKSFWMAPELLKVMSEQDLDKKLYEL